MKRRRRLLGAGWILAASLLLMTACGRKSEPAEEIEEAYEDAYTPSAEEISDALTGINEELTQSQVLNGDVFEFYIDNDVNIVKLQMPVNYVKEGAPQTGSTFETEVDTTGEWRGHYEIKVTVHSMERARGARELLESRYPDESGGKGFARVDPHGAEGTYRSIYETRFSDGFKSADRKTHGEKTIGFGFGSNETEAVLLIEAVTGIVEFGEYNGINEVLDSIVLVNVDDNEARLTIARLEEEYEEKMEERMQDAITISNPDICRDICQSLGLAETDRFTLEELEEVYEIDCSLLRDEDVEWLPYISLFHSYLDFWGNENITDLRVLTGFEKLKEYDDIFEMVNVEQCGNLTSLDGIEELFGEDGPVLEQFTIHECPNLEDISALKKIGLCEYIYIDLDECELITWEMVEDVYDSNPNIGSIRISSKDGPTGNVYDLDSRSGEVDKRIREWEEEREW